MNCKKLIFSALMAALCIAVPSQTAVFANENFAENYKIEYLKDGKVIHSISDGEVSSQIYLTNLSLNTQKITVINAAYEGNSLCDISVGYDEIIPQMEAGLIKGKSVTLSKNADMVKTFMFDSGRQPVSKSSFLTKKSGEKEITSFKMKIGKYEFEGDINDIRSEIKVFVPTEYCRGNYVENITEAHEKIAPVVEKQTFENAIKSIVPTIEGVGNIEGKNEKRDFSSPVLYTVRGEDGSERIYKVSVVEGRLRRYQDYSGSGISLVSGLPNDKNQVGTATYGYVDYEALEHPGVESSIDGGYFRFKKTKKAQNDDFYSCSQFRYDYHGYAKETVLELDMRIGELSEGDGMVLSLFSTERDNKKNGNLIIKKSGNNAKLYWSRKGYNNPKLIEEAPVFTLGQFHKIKFVRTMNPVEQINRKYKGNIDFYLDGEFIASFLDTNYITPNGDTKSSPSKYHNGAYNHVAIGSVSHTEEGGVTYTVDIRSISMMAGMYENCKTSPAVPRKINAELEAILKRFDSYFGIENALWVAKRYDRDSGAFYHSVSAQTYPYFAPDIQSSSQAVGYIQSAGLWDSEVNEAGMVPDFFRENLCKFAQVRQSDDDGYFYDTQFGKNVTDSKRGRNLYQSEHLISLVPGAKPYYKLPSERIETSATIYETDDRFTSEENFIKWLDQIFKGGDYYVAGNEVAAAWTTIEAVGLGQVAYDYIMAKQNPETGLWGSGVNMAAVNGAMKCTVVCRVGPFKNFEKAIRSIIQVMKERETVTVAELWNPLTLIDTINSSIEDGLSIEEWEFIDSELVEMLTIMEEALTHFRQSDNGYSWYRYGSSPQGQGAHVSMGLPEGDMDANELARRVREDVYRIIGKNITPLFSTEDKWLFWNTIRNSETVPKIPLEQLPTTLSTDFDGVTDGLGEGFRAIRRKNDTVGIYNSSGNNVLRIKGGGYGNTTVDAVVRVPESYKTCVVKFKMYVKNDGVQMYNTIGSGRANAGAVSWCLIGDGVGNAKLYIRRSNQGLGKEIMTLKTGQWYTFEMRYSPDDTGREVIIAVDGQKRYTGSDYYNGGDNTRAPERYVDGLGFTTFAAGVGTIYVDEIRVYYEY